MTGPQDGLSIGELAKRTGVPAPTLRSWEDRCGFPRPRRLAGGHRRYDEGDIALIEAAVVRLRSPTSESRMAQVTWRRARRHQSGSRCRRRRPHAANGS